MVAAIRRDGGKVPGFGHPLHKPVDPRAERILALADARGVAGPHCRLARATAPAVAEAWGKPLTLNVSMAIAAVLLDLGFPPAMLKAIPILARTASLLAHLAEEQERPIGFLMAAHAEEAIAYDGGAGVTRRPIADAPTTPLPGADRLPPRALGLLPRQARRRGLRRRRRGRRARRHRPPAVHREGRAARGPSPPTAPIGAHLAAPMAEVVRIYSTSGTTGAPSYIPLTRADLADWIAISSPLLRRLGRRAPASGSSPPTTPAPSSPAWRSRPSHALGLCHIPVGSGHAERLLAAVDPARARRSSR